MIKNSSADWNLNFTPNIYFAINSRVHIHWTKLNSINYAISRFIAEKIHESEAQKNQKACGAFFPAISGAQKENTQN